MLQVSLIAVPTYLGLLVLSIPFDMNVGVQRGLGLFVPVVVFATGSVLYSLSFLTVLPSLERDSFDSSARLRQRVFRRKMMLMLLGSISLLLGILSSGLLLLKAHL